MSKGNGIIHLDLIAPVVTKPVKTKKPKKGKGNILVYDTFEGEASEVLLSAHTPNVDTVGGGWTETPSGNMKVDPVLDVATCSNTSQTFGVIDAGVSDCIITATPQYHCNLSVSPAHAYLLLRYVDNTRYLVFGIVSSSANPLEFALWSVVAGVGTTKLGSGFGVSGGIPYTFTDNVTITMNGSSIRCEMENEGVDFTVNTTTFQTSTIHGMRMNRNSNANTPARVEVIKMESL